MEKTFKFLFLIIALGIVLLPIGLSCEPEEAVNNTPKVISVENFSDSLVKHYWWINCTAGNVTNSSEIRTFRIDTLPPVTTITPNETNWTSYRDFTLTCSDETSGCNTTQYKIINSTDDCNTSGLTTGTSGTVTCSDNQTCLKKVCFISNDSFGNTEEIKTSGVFKIDRTVFNNEPKVISLENFSEAKYYWWIECTANATTNYSEIRTFRIDLTFPVITITSPTNNTRYNFILNLTTNISDESGISYAYYNITNSTGNQVATGELNDSNNYDSTFNTSTVSDGNYSFFVGANDTAGNEANKTVNFVVDNTNPIISEGSYPPSSGSFVWGYLLGNITWDTQITDSNLYQIILNITNSTGDSKFSYYMEDWNSTTFNFFTQNITTNITGWEDGNYTINISASDDHTKKTIPDYQIKKLINGIEFEKKIQILSKDSLFKDYKTEKKKDRYTIDFILKTEEKERKYYNFIIKSEERIIYRPNSKYKAHFVTGDYWVDFENKDEKAEYKIKKISNFEYEITIFTKDLSFESIGGLNKISQTYNLEIDNNFYIISVKGVYPSGKEDVGNEPLNNLLINVVLMIAIILTIVGSIVKKL